MTVLWSLVPGLESGYERGMKEETIKLRYGKKYAYVSLLNIHATRVHVGHTVYVYTVFHPENWFRRTL